MEKDLELFYEYLESPLWIHPITQFMSELYCAYAYNHDFQNGKNDEMNRKYYQKYCTLLGDLLTEFSSEYELDTSKVSQLMNTSIEQALPVAKHLIAAQSYKQFVDLMKSYTIELKMQPSVESAGVPLLTGKLTRTSSCLYDQKCMEKKMQEFAKQRGHSLLMKRKSVLQQSKDIVTHKETRNLYPQLVTKAHLDTPGMGVAMAYGFVAYENSVEYRMQKWYEEEKTHMIHNTSITQDEGECSKSRAEDTVDDTTGQNKSNDNNQQPTELPRRNSKLKTSLKSKLDNIPEANEDHSETK